MNPTRGVWAIIFTRRPNKFINTHDHFILWVNMTWLLRSLYTLVCANINNGRSFTAASNIRLRIAL